MRLLLLLLVLHLGGCAGTSEGKRRSWNPWYGAGPVELESCAADCAEWDEEGRMCLRFHRWTSERCARLLSRELQR